MSDQTALRPHAPVFALSPNHIMTHGRERDERAPLIPPRTNYTAGLEARTIAAARRLAALVEPRPRSRVSRAFQQKNEGHGCNNTRDLGPRQPPRPQLQQDHRKTHHGDRRSSATAAGEALHRRLAPALANQFSGCSFSSRLFQQKTHVASLSRPPPNHW